ncbi:MAG: hypothetical protein EA376_14415 [Phycisphaeraceae bacterium]|nr:MAG: hypothetical protein EA376_14415 [Phycisphaeraceae bacterium]
MQRILCATMALCLVMLAGCQNTGPRTERSDARAHLFEGMGDTHLPVATTSARAQRYFDQGLVWMYAFNHDEAIRSFREAARLDPECAMAWWGIALSYGPNYNQPIMSEEANREAWTALRRAMELRHDAPPAERALIEAVNERYIHDPPDDRSELDKAYADAMERVYNAHRNDADIVTLYAESLMNLQPWDLWTKDGEPKGNADKIVAVLERALELDPEHVGAHHLYIHAVEASADPGRAVASADFLRTAVPASGHLLHMPSHIDVRMGDWSAAAESNRRAIEVDQAYTQLSPDQGFYRVYMAHNHHFLSFVGMMQGRQSEALAAARNMIGGVPREYIREDGEAIDPYMSIELAAMMRFGMWDEILRTPRPARELPITRAMWRFTRAVAYANQNQFSQADREREAFHDEVARLPDDAMMVINPASHVLAIAEHMLDGEIAYLKGDIDEAVHHLKAAIELEDDLLYMEPPEWLQPVRHTLGAILVEAGRYSEAEEVYRADLKNWPENGWSLFGLARSLESQGQTEEALAMWDRFDEAWAEADTEIKSTCFCVTTQ